MTEAAARAAVMSDDELARELRIAWQPVDYNGPVHAKDWLAVLNRARELLAPAPLSDRDGLAEKVWLLTYPHLDNLDADSKKFYMIAWNRCLAVADLFASYGAPAKSEAEIVARVQNMRGKLRRYNAGAIISLSYVLALLDEVELNRKPLDTLAMESENSTPPAHGAEAFSVKWGDAMGLDAEDCVVLKRAVLSLLASETRGMRDMLERAERQFRFYAGEHVNKGSFEKARINFEFAADCFVAAKHAALAPTAAQLGGAEAKETPLADMKLVRRGHVVPRGWKTTGIVSASWHLCHRTES